MSFTQELNKIVNNAIKQYTNVIADKYNLSEEELIEIWNLSFSDEKISASADKKTSRTSKRSPAEKKS